MLHNTVQNVRILLYCSFLNIYVVLRFMIGPTKSNANKIVISEALLLLELKFKIKKFQNPMNQFEKVKPQNLIPYNRYATTV